MQCTAGGFEHRETVVVDHHRRVGGSKPVVVTGEASRQ